MLPRLGLLFNIAASGVYYFAGFSPLLFCLWLGGLVVFASALKQPNEWDWKWEASDWKAIALLLGGFVPLYLLSIHTIPYQLNTDEVTIMRFEALEAGSPSPDLFGLSSYFGVPKFVFITFGWLAGLLGGVNLHNARLVHAGGGVLIVLTGYLLFREHAGKRLALMATVLMGANHGLLAVSRMAMVHNSALLAEIAGLLLLFAGLMRASVFLSFTGAAVLGLTFYTYFAGRIAVVIWALFVGGLLVFARGRSQHRAWLAPAAVSALGFCLVVAPVMLATFKTASSAAYAKHQLLIYPEGRQLQQEWWGARTEAVGYAINVVNGLTTFNNTDSDEGWLYPNPGHGFVDPLSGVLLWIGLAAWLYQSRWRTPDPFPLLMFCGFTLLYLTFAFVVNKAPHYTRLLLILPFFAFFAAHGITALERLAGRVLKRPGVVSPVLLLVCVLWNVAIFGDFVRRGRAEGDTVGSTARFVESKNSIPGHAFYLAASPAYPYYEWGEDWQWKEWLGFFAAADQQAFVIEPGAYSSLPERSFTVFMSETAWSETGGSIRERHANLRVHSMRPDGSLLAVEVP